jgi:hypothetical protein
MVIRPPGPRRRGGRGPGPVVTYYCSNWPRRATAGVICLTRMTDEDVTQSDGGRAVVLVGHARPTAAAFSSRQTHATAVHGNRISDGAWTDGMANCWVKK